MAKTINLGKVGLTFEGDYDSSKNYASRTCVFYNHVSWASKKDVPAGIAPGTNAEYWQKVSERGAQGIQGERGPQGNSAFDGTGIELVNSLTQGGEASALSAEQGKILKEELTELESEILQSDIKNSTNTTFTLIGADNTNSFIETTIEGNRRYCIRLDAKKWSVNNVTSLYAFAILVNDRVVVRKLATDVVNGIEQLYYFETEAEENKLHIDFRADNGVEIKTDLFCLDNAITLENSKEIAKNNIKITNNCISFVWRKDEFVQGSISTLDGSDSATTVRLRSRNRAYIKAGSTIRLVISNGQNIILGKYNKDGYVASSPYYADTDIVIDEDCEIRVLVSYNELKDIIPSENACSVLINTIVLEPIEKELSKINNDFLGYVWKAADFEQGSISPVDGSNGDSSVRIRTKEKRRFKKGETFSIVIGEKQSVIIGKYVGGTYSASPSIVASTNYIVDEDCEIRVLISYKDLKDIIPSDNTCRFLTNADLLNNSVGVVERNQDKQNRLVASSLNGRNFQICLFSDAHNDQQRVKNSTLVTEGFNTITSLIGLGDFVLDNMLNRADADFVFDVSNGMKKPMLLVLGNHDVGNNVYIAKTLNQQESYDIWMKPLHDRGVLNDIENPLGMCYWYKDFADKKVRMIGLNCYDEDIEIDLSNWDIIPYDSSYQIIKGYTTYQSGAVVNIPNFTRYSFVAKKEIVTEYELGEAVVETSAPRYKCKRGTFVIGETQANWFADRLNDTPEGYGVIVALHGAFSDKCYNRSDLKFGNSAIINEQAYAGSHYMMKTDFLAEIVNAYINRTNYNQNVQMVGYASYMNKQGSGEDAYAYTIRKDFSNAKGKFICWLGGHWHKDIIWNHPIYNNQYQIAPTWTNEAYWWDWCGKVDGQQTDICTSETDNVSNDCLTIVSVDVDKDIITLNKVGQDVTTLGERRDIEVIKVVI